MSFFIYGILITMFEIILFVLSLIKKDKYYWKQLYKTLILGIGGVILFEIIYYLVDKSESLAILIYWLMGIIFGGLSVLLLIATLILNKIFKDKIKDNNTNNDTLNNIFLVYIILYIIAISIEYYPKVVDIYRRKAYSKDIETYLTEKYGDGDFKVIDVYDERSCFMGCSSNNYRITITSSYLERSFEAQMNISTKEINYEEFMNIYAFDSKLCGDDKGINSCLDDYMTKKVNANLTRPDVYSVDITTSLDGEKFSDKKFGKIPEIEDLEDSSTINFNNFTIKKELKETDEEEFKKIILDMYNDYMKYMYQNNESKDKNIVRFKFDYINPFYKGMNGYNPYKQDGYFKIEDNKLIAYYRPQGTTIDFKTTN